VRPASTGRICGEGACSRFDVAADDDAIAEGIVAAIVVPRVVALSGVPDVIGDPVCDVGPCTAPPIDVSPAGIDGVDAGADPGPESPTADASAR